MKFKKSTIFFIFKCVVLNAGHTRINLALRKHIAAKLDLVSTCYLVPCYVTAFHRTVVIQSFLLWVCRSPRFMISKYLDKNVPRDFYRGRWCPNDGKDSRKICSRFLRKGIKRKSLTRQKKERVERALEFQLYQSSAKVCLLW